MRFELFGIARVRAGREVVDLDAATLGASLCQLAEACPGLVPEVVTEVGLADGYLASLNGERFVNDGAIPLRETDTVLILGAQAGG
jgi:molybdopterin synthase sulfur carrier subunit